MQRLLDNVRHFVDSNRGVAAIEFAMIMSFLLLAFLGSFDAGGAIAVYAKVRAATYSLGAITNQYGDGTNPNYPPISPAQMTTITGAASAVLAPYPSAPITLVISQIKATSASTAVVSWSYSPTAGQALTQAPSLPSGFAANTCNGAYPCYFILASVSYSFTPMFGAFLTGPIILADSLYTTPRSSACVQYNGTPATC